jgi:putative oxidoreductase
MRLVFFSANNRRIPPSPIVRNAGGRRLTENEFHIGVLSLKVDAERRRSVIALERITRPAMPIVKGLDFLNPLVDLGVRLWVANVFWKSGLASLHDWQGTLDLFSYEFHVPLLPPVVAAYLGTGIELVFPVFLALGLGSRLSAFVLFVFNIMAVISYPALNEAGLKDHMYWGMLLLISLLHGPGRISLDHLICRKLKR